MMNNLALTGVLEDVNALGGALGPLLINVVLWVIAIWYVAKTFHKSGPLAALGALALSIVVLAGVANMTLLRDKAAEDIKNPSTTQVVVDPTAGSK